MLHVANSWEISIFLPNIRNKNSHISVDLQVDINNEKIRSYFTSPLFS